MKNSDLQSASEIVIFGALGDLSRRKLIPALYQLDQAGLLNVESRIVGVARQEHTVEELTSFVVDNLTEFVKEGLDKVSTSGASISTSRRTVRTSTGSGTPAYQHRFRHPCAASRRTTTASRPTTYHPCAASRRTTTAGRRAGTSAIATGAAARISARLHLDPVDAAAPSSQTPVGLPGKPANSATLPARTSRVILLSLRPKPRGYAALLHIGPQH